MKSISYLPLLFAWLLVSNSGQPSMAAEKIDVLLVTGQSSRYHNWKVQSTAYKQILDETGLFTVEVAKVPEAEGEVSQFHPKWNDYAAVVLDYEGDEWPEATKSGFESYVSGGGGLVLLHASDNAFPGWVEFNKMIGIGGWGGRTEVWGPKVRWREGKMVLDESPGTASHPPKHDFLVTTRAPNHPIMQGLPAEWLHAHDEMYSQLRGPAENLTVLATAVAEPSKVKNGTGENEPMLMAIDYGQGRVFHSTLGHVGANETAPVTSISCAGFIVTLQRGTEWAATGKVTQEVPKDFPTAEKTSVRK